MRYQEALIAWTPGTDQIKVGNIMQRGEPNWTRHPVNYKFTGGAAYAATRINKDKTQRDLMLFIEFNTIVVRDNVPVEAAHKAFLAIDEYRERISPDIEGALDRD